MPRLMLHLTAISILCLSAAATPVPCAAAGGLPHVFLDRYIDKTEGAFIVSVPRGWQTRGGIVRVNPLSAGGAGQSIEAKIDFAMMREPEGKVAIRWLPKINYVEPSPYNAMLNGNWNGMPILPMQTPRDYLLRILFPQLHPQGRGVQVADVKQRPDVAAAIRGMPGAQAIMSQGGQYGVDAAAVTVTYEDGGVRYKEVLFTAIEGFAMAGVAMWSNPFTLAARAPEADYDTYGPVAIEVINSFALNPRWMAAEVQGQIQRGDLVQKTLAEIARIDAEIAENRSRTMSQINDDQYLTLTSQERYMNPHTGREELGSNEWKYRWADPSGRVIYTDDPDWDPNLDPDLHVVDFKRTPVKQRR